MVQTYRDMYNQWLIQTFSRGGSLICFKVFHVYFFFRGGPKSIAKLEGDHCRIFFSGSASVYNCRPTHVGLLIDRKSDG